MKLFSITHENFEFELWKEKSQHYQNHNIIIILKLSLY